MCWSHAGRLLASVRLLRGWGKELEKHTQGGGGKPIGCLKDGEGLRSGHVTVRIHHGTAATCWAVVVPRGVCVREACGVMMMRCG